MVKMLLIEINNNIVKYKCLPNGIEDDSFIMEINVLTKELLNSTVEMNNYLLHAMYKIFEIYDEAQTIPEIAISVWY